MRSLKSAHLFRDPLTFGIDICRIKRIRPAEVVLWHMRESSGLFAVHSTGTSQKKLAHTMSPGKIKRPRRAIDDRRQHVEWTFGSLRSTALCGSVNDVAKNSFRKREGPNIAG
jgi:hypothetical protein